LRMSNIRMIVTFAKVFCNLDMNYTVVLPRCRPHSNFVSHNLLALLITCTFAASFARPVQADLLAILAPDALVVVGDQAPPAEKAAADRLAARLRDAGGPTDNEVSASAINVDLERAATHHLLVVGTESSNVVMAREPSHWVMNRDVYYATHPPYADYVPTHGFYVAGYATFPSGDIGYIEWDRNPYWEYATNLGSVAGQSAPVAPDLPYRQIARFYGSTPAGVAAAVDAFLTRHVLTGVVAPNGTLPGRQTLFSIDTAHYALPTSAPAWIPATDLKDGGVVLTFAGWHVADSMTYSGFAEASGVPALSIWRAKYITEQGWNYPKNVVIDPAHEMTRSPLFEASLDRRASDNEFFVARFASPELAASAVKGAVATLTAHRPSHAPWTTETIGGATWNKSRFGVHIVAFGDYLIVESFDDAHKALALSAISAKIGALK